jgi:hypothetical protein
MVAFHATQPLVDGTVGIAFDGNRAIAGNTNQQAAAGTAEPARRFFPLNSTCCRINLFPGTEGDSREKGCSRCSGTVYCQGFDE